MILKTFTILLFTICMIFEISAQNDTLDIASESDSLITIEADTLLTKGVKKKSPTRAFIYSALVPGLGQAYNGKYWKIPIVYSALGGVAFLFNKNNIQYKRHLKGLTELYQYQKDTTTILTVFDSDADISKKTVLKDNYRRNRDLSALIFIAVYALNFIDATVDAHLSDFDVSDDLSIKFKPEIIPLYAAKNKNTIGLTIRIQF